MNTPLQPRSKSHTASPDRQHSAQLTAALTAVGGRKDVAEGDLSALLPDPRTNTGPVPVGWLHVRAPGRGAVTSATSVCACGRDRHAIGHKRVAALINDHTEHRDVCPLRTSAEGRAAA